MRRFFWLMPLLVTLALAVAVVLFAGAHSWSSEATAWAITAVLGGSTVIDLTLSRWWERSSRHHHRDRATSNRIR